MAQAHSAGDRQQQADRDLLHHPDRRQRERGVTRVQPFEQEPGRERHRDDRERARHGRQRHGQRDVGAGEKTEDIGRDGLRRRGRQDQAGDDGRPGMQRVDEAGSEQREHDELDEQRGRHVQRVMHDALQVGERQLEADDDHRHRDQQRQADADGAAHGARSGGDGGRFIEGS